MIFYIYIVYMHNVFACFWFTTLMVGWEVFYTCSNRGPLQFCEMSAMVPHFLPEPLRWLCDPLWKVGDY